MTGLPHASLLPPVKLLGEGSHGRLQRGANTLELLLSCLELLSARSQLGVQGLGSGVGLLQVLIELIPLLLHQLRLDLDVLQLVSGAFKGVLQGRDLLPQLLSLGLFSRELGLEIRDLRLELLHVASSLSELRSKLCDLGLQLSGIGLDLGQALLLRLQRCALLLELRLHVAASFALGLQLSFDGRGAGLLFPELLFHVGFAAA
mmetsp:Transcript_41549/g.90624  ORF Transcript_41549/g.90624 Transcript_41549/m.90624 type:complete len:204 (+) Transcript_41549:100-711(+)